jgi:hypothetical protein
MTFEAPTSTISTLHKKEAAAYFQDDYATITLDESIPCIRTELNGVPRSSEHYQYVQLKRLELVLQEIGKYPKLHLLTDSSNAGPVLDEDVEHFRRNILPEIEKAGVQNLAIVLPKSKYTILTIREMTEHTHSITVRYFETIQEAKIWLKKMTLA